jgi:hypothetical protein
MQAKRWIIPACVVGILAVAPIPYIKAITPVYAADLYKPVEACMTSYNSCMGGLEAIKKRVPGAIKRVFKHVKISRIYRIDWIVTSSRLGRKQARLTAGDMHHRYRRIARLAKFDSAFNQEWL